MLDGVFGKERFLNEITWQRTFAHGNVGRNYGKISDSIFFYSKSDDYVWNQAFSLESETDENTQPLMKMAAAGSQLRFAILACDQISTSHLRQATA